LQDGTKVYQGTGQSVIDSNLVNGQIYSYTLFPLDSSGAILTPVQIAQATPQANLNLANPATPNPNNGNPVNNANSAPGLNISGQNVPIAASVIKLVNDKGTFYLISDNFKHGITNPGILATYGLSFKDAKPVTALDQALIDDGLLSPADGALVKSKQDPTVYLISKGQRYGFISGKVFLALGFKFSSVLIVTNPELQSLPKADNLADTATLHSQGVDVNIKGAIYWIGDVGQRHLYPSLSIYNTWHLHNDFSKVVPANPADLQLPIGSPVPPRVLG